jgi:chromosomal replication initiator protein
MSMDSLLNTKWNKCLEIIRDNVSETTFSTWFADIKPLKFEGGTLTIQVKSNFVYEFLEGNFVDLLRSTLFKVMGNGTQLMYSVLTDKDNNLSVEVGTDSTNSRHKGSGNSGNSAPKAMQECVQELDSMLINRYTFDNYVEGISNRLSRSVAISVADKPGRAFNPLFIHGVSGVGKTHLALSLAVRGLDLGYTVAFETLDNLMTILKTVEISKANKRRLKYLRKAALVIVDEVGCKCQ